MGSLPSKPIAEDGSGTGECVLPDSEEHLLHGSFELDNKEDLMKPEVEALLRLLVKPEVIAEIQKAPMIVIVVSNKGLTYDIMVPIPGFVDQVDMTKSFKVGLGGEADRYFTSVTIAGTTVVRELVFGTLKIRCVISYFPDGMEILLSAEMSGNYYGRGRLNFKRLYRDLTSEQISGQQLSLEGKSIEQLLANVMEESSTDQKTVEQPHSTGAEETLAEQNFAQQLTISTGEVSTEQTFAQPLTISTGEVSTEQTFTQQLTISTGEVSTEQNQ